MMLRFAALLALLLTAAPVAAQDQTPPPAAQPAEDQGLSVTVTDESAWENLQVAIPAFATDREAPTPANSSGTTALGLELSRVIYNDLRNNALFKPTGPDSLPRPGIARSRRRSSAPGADGRRKTWCKVMSGPAPTGV